MPRKQAWQSVTHTERAKDTIESTGENKMRSTVLCVVTLLTTSLCFADTNVDFGTIQTMHFWEGHDGLLVVHETQQAAENCARGDFYILPKTHVHYSEMLDLISSAFIEGKNARLRLIGCSENFPRIAHVYVSAEQGSGSGPAYTRREATFTVNAGSLRTTQARCQAGETVIGGGYLVEDDTNLNVWENAPNGNLTRWRVSVSNFGTANRSGTVYAICVAD